MACWEERNLTQDSALQGVEGVLPLVELELLDRTTEPEGWSPLWIRHLEGRSLQATSFLSLQSLTKLHSRYTPDS